MADLNKLLPIIAQWEGGWSDDENDHGGKTNRGITLETWRNEGYDKDLDGDIDEYDLMMIDNGDFNMIVSRRWKWWKADRIKNQSIANLVVDWTYNSGSWGIKIPQRVIGVNPDGKVGNDTLNAINSGNQKDIFTLIWNARFKFINDIVSRDPSQKRFLKGWLNRLNSFKFKDNE